VRIGELARIAQPPCGGAHLDGGIRTQGSDGQVDDRRIEERLIALHVDDQPGAAPVRRSPRGDQCRTRAPRGQTGHAAKVFDRLHHAFVVGSDHDAVERTRCRGAAIHVLDHRTAADVEKRFAGESGGLKTGGDDPEDRRFGQRER
jgi:hypothetical protein